MKFFLLFSVAFAMILIGCSPAIRDIPAGFCAKKLTPSGWDKTILGAGQVDIGQQDNGSYTSLVLLEVTSVAVKESFGQSVNGGEDHRILVGKTPVSVDVYVRMMAPQDPERRNALFAQITPIKTGVDRVSMITVEQIYKQFAQMDVRSGIREILQKETVVDSVTRNLGKLNDELGAMVIKMFKRSGVPLDVQNVTLSNVKMDQTVWDAENQKAAALAQVEAINKIGAALRANPEYGLFKKYDTYEKIKDKIGSFTIIDGSPSGIVIGK